MLPEDIAREITIIEQSNAALPEWAKAALLQSKIAEQNRKNEHFESDIHDLEEFTKITLDLSTAREQVNAMEVPFKFKAVRVESATDSTVSVSLIRGRLTDNRPSAALRQNDVANFGRQNRGFLFWTAQSGKTITLLFAVDADFQQGSLIVQTSGGVAISEGTAVAGSAYISVDNTADQICAQDTTRIVSIVQNQDAALAIYVGASDVTGPAGLKPGTKLEPGGVLYWKNSAALYGITAAGTNASIAVLNET